MARYFREIEPDPAIARTYVILQETIANLTARGRIIDARRVLHAYIEMRARYAQLGIEAAAFSEEAIRQRLDSSEVGRPPTSQRLKRAIQSRPIRSGLPAGAVGIGDLSRLNKATRRRWKGRTYKPYWRAQEYGYDGNAGRLVPGYFMPGEAAPSLDEFRDHPFFERRAYVAGQGETPPAMRIGNEIQARHFMLNGVADTLVWYRAEAATVQSKILSRVEPRRRR